MNAAEVLVAVQKAGASLRVEGDSLVASNASRIAPAIKAAIREHKPEIIAALSRPACKVEIRGPPGRRAEHGRDREPRHGQHHDVSPLQQAGARAAG
jgi:hypothetical protein